MESQLLEPVTYYKNLNGKNIRFTFIHILGTMFSVSKEDVAKINYILHTLHNASLVIDDIEDHSLTRRNHDCAHVKYGIPMALNAGYLASFKILSEINNDPDISQTFKNNFINYLYYAHVGQGMDIYYSENNAIPELEEYKKMMEYKTGILFMIGLDFLHEKTKNVIMKKRYDTIKHALVLFSYFFQIRDDYINLTDPVYWKERGFCQDMDEGKISYLICYYYHKKLPHYETIVQRMEESKNNNEKKTELLLLFHEHGLFDMIYDELVVLQQEILAILNIEMMFDYLPFQKMDINNIPKFLS